MHRHVFSTKSNLLLYYPCTIISPAFFTNNISCRYSILAVRLSLYAFDWPSDPLRLYDPLMLLMLNTDPIIYVSADHWTGIVMAFVRVGPPQLMWDIKDSGRYGQLAPSLLHVKRLGSKIWNSSDRNCLRADHGLRVSMTRILRD